MDIPLTPLRRKKIPEKEPKNEPNKQARCIVATGTEWKKIGGKAKEAGLS